MRALVGVACVSVIAASGIFIYKEMRSDEVAARQAVSAEVQQGSAMSAPPAVPTSTAATQLAATAASRQSWIKSTEPILSYLKESGQRFPISVVDRVNFFNPRLLDARTVLNLVQIDFMFADLRKVSEPAIMQFLSKAVEITQIFNCENHRKLLDMGVVILNIFHTREIDPSQMKSLPAISLNNQTVEASEGFVTTKATCDTVGSSRPEFVVKANSHPEERLLQLIVKQRPRGMGTAWPISNGLIVTNYHVVNASNRIYVVRSDREFREATVVAADRFRDIAILKVDDREFLPSALELAEGEHDIGEPVMTVGYPWTGAITNRLPQVQLSQGIISSLPENGIHYQLSMPVQSGNSGGPLVTNDGKVTGIIVSKLKEDPSGQDKPENVAQAIRVEHLKRMLEDLSHDNRNEVLKFAPNAQVAEVARQVRDSVLLVLTF